MKQCNEGYQLFMLWYRSLTNGGGREAYEYRRIYDKHLDECPNCRRDENDNTRISDDSD